MKSRENFCNVCKCTSAIQSNDASTLDMEKSKVITHTKWNKKTSNEIVYTLQIYYSVKDYYVTMFSFLCFTSVNRSLSLYKWRAYRKIEVV